jgi:hypothetical protein
MAKLVFIRDDEGTTQVQGRLVTVVVLVTQNTGTASLKDKRQRLADLMLDPSQGKASKDMTMSHNHGVARSVLLDSNSVISNNLLN